MCENSDLREEALLVAERKAIVHALDRVYAAARVPEKECVHRIALACVSLGAEMWTRLHPTLDEAPLTELYGELAKEAVTGYYDATVVVLAQRGNVKGGQHA
jgi:hypothetical protein